MSLGSLARYDDAEDEIKDEDHDLVLQPPASSNEAYGQDIQEDQNMEVEAKPSPLQIAPKAPKQLALVDYGDMSDDDDEDMSESEPDDDEESKIEVVNPKSTSIVNLGLYDVSTVLPSVDSEFAVPARLNDNYTETASPIPDRVQLPPEPEGRCSKSLQDRIANMLEKKRAGQMNLNEYIERKKDFRNPSIYEKLISFIGIDEHGTNFPRKLYDPSIWGPEDYYEELAKKQKEYHKEKEKEKAKRTQVDFVSGVKKPNAATSQPPVAATTASTTASSTGEKKSKWDQKVAPPPKSIQIAKSK